MGGRVLVVGYKCQRCSHIWAGKGKQEPKVCPRCHSAYWNKSRGERKIIPEQKSSSGMYEKKFAVELDPGVGAEHVKTVVSDAIEEAKNQNPGKAKDLQGLHYKTGDTIYQLTEGVPPELLLVVAYTYPFAILTFKEIVIPLIQKRLKIKEYYG